MAEIKWIKLSVNMFDDEKIKLIRTMPEGDKIIVIWVQMLCMAGKTNDGGAVYMGQNLYYTDEMLATLCGQPVNVMRLALQTLHQFGMIEKEDDGKIEITNWEKHQNIDGMEKIQKQNSERKKRFDLRKKLKGIGYDPDKKDVPHDVEELEEFVSNVTVTLCNATEEEKKKRRIEEDKDINTQNTSSATADGEYQNEFESIWKIYPNKKGKQQALKAYKKSRKNGTDRQSIESGVNQYAEYVKKNRIEIQFQKHGSTFFTQEAWADEYDVGDQNNKQGVGKIYEGIEF
jgi:predicted phage replisome organizer